MALMAVTGETFVQFIVHRVDDMISHNDTMFTYPRATAGANN